MLGSAELRLNFSSFLRDVPDIPRFAGEYLTSQCLLENLGISEASLGVLDKFKCGSAVPNIKYNCSVFFETNVLIIYVCFQIYFSQTTIVKIIQN